MAKCAKNEVRYGLADVNSHDHCGICRYYRIGSCSKVEGHIDRRMWCRLFERRDDR